MIQRLPHPFRDLLWSPLFALTLVALGTGLLVADVARAETEPREVSILYNGSVRGELIDCGCKARPLGGLARRAAFIEHLEAAHPHTVLIDAGNLFADPAGDAVEQSRFVAEQTAKMGYSVVGVGPYEIGHGVDAVRRIAASTGMEFVSANLADASGDLLFAPYEIVEKNGVRIAVTSVYDPALATAPYDAKVSGLQALSPLETLRNWLPELNAKADVVVVLSNLNGSGGVELLRALGDTPAHRIDFVIEGLAERQYPNPRQFGASRMLAANARGKYLGQVSLVVSGSEIVDVMNEVHPLDTKLAEEPTMAEAVQQFQDAHPSVAGGR